MNNFVLGLYFDLSTKLFISQSTGKNHLRAAFLKGLMELSTQYTAYNNRCLYIYKDNIILLNVKKLINPGTSDFSLSGVGLYSEINIKPVII